MLKKVFFGLVLAALVVIAGTAHAQQDAPYLVNGMFPLLTDLVFENPGGLGDTLLYGYYNVRGFNNFIALINTDVSGVVGRIRFREAKASNEVLDFNICLSAGDAWFAIIYDDGTQAYIQPFGIDTKTRPAFIGEDDGNGNGIGVAFRHADNGGLEGVTADDTKEGYVEFIGLIRTAAKFPADEECPAETAGDATNDVRNSLMGGLYLVDPTSGEAFGYKATALANINIEGIDTAGISAEDVTLETASLGGIEVVNFALAKANLYGAYVVTDDPGIQGETAFVVTFPTKKISEEVRALGCVGCSGIADDPNTPNVNEADLPLFDRETDTGCPAGFNNVRVAITVWDDAENKFTTGEAPSPVREVIEDFCYEVNVRELDNDQVTSNVLESLVETPLPLGAFVFGYIDLSLTAEPNHLNLGVSLGVPALGLQLHRFVNGAGSMSVPMWYRTIVPQ